MKIDGVEGFILAGGQSRRMGRPKALLEVGGKPIITRLTGNLTSVLARVTIVTDRPDEVAFLGLPVIADLHAGKGPLGGLHASLSAAKEETIFLASADLPFLTAAFLTALHAHHETSQVTIATAGSLVHPLAGYYDRSLLPAVEEALAASRLRMSEFLERISPQSVPLAILEQPDEVLFNVNTPEDLEEARRLAERKD